MVQFSRLISETWNISDALAKEVCQSFQQGDSAFYVVDYHPGIAAELEASQIHEIYDFLKEVADLAPKKKRLINALTKSNDLTPAVEERIQLTTSSYELDDMLVPYRLNSRSKGQLAVQKGLAPLAGTIEKQEVETGSLDDLAEPFVGKDSTLSTPDDVLSNAKEIIIERFSSDETVRAMVRDFAYDEGTFEIISKKKKEKTGGFHPGQFINPHEYMGERLLELFVAEDTKELRLRLDVQLFRITELLRQHFITNPDSISFDFICEAIDECWSRYLQPLVDRDVKDRLRRQAEDRVAHQINEEIKSLFSEATPTGTACALATDEGRRVAVVAFDSEGHLLGATTLSPKEKIIISDRARQFFSRYRPTRIIIAGETDAEEQTIAEVLSASPSSEVIRRPIADQERAIAHSQWMKSEFADLDEQMQLTFATGLAYIRPWGLVPRIGINCFSIHPLQKLLPIERMARIINQRVVEKELHRGVPITKVPQSALELIGSVPEKALDELRKRAAKYSLASKDSLLSIPGMTTVGFRNMAGYILVPDAVNPLDRSLVHPDHFEWIESICAELDISLEQLIEDPEIIRSCPCDDYVKKLYIEKCLLGQLKTAQQYAGAAVPVVRKKLKLTDLTESSVVSGRVTNITPFGVFVDINAVCDGLIHISQLADAYVESPEQVVSVNDRINVRIIKVDVKKRRISLSMKNLGNLAPKIRPSKGQLSTLADHFKNR